MPSRQLIALLQKAIVFRKQDRAEYEALISSADGGGRPAARAIRTDRPPRPDRGGPCDAGAAAGRTLRKPRRTDRAGGARNTAFADDRACPRHGRSTGRHPRARRGADRPAGDAAQAAARDHSRRVRLGFQSRPRPRKHRNATSGTSRSPPKNLVAGRGPKQTTRINLGLDLARLVVRLERDLAASDPALERRPLSRAPIRSIAPSSRACRRSRAPAITHRMPTS